MSVAREVAARTVSSIGAASAPGTAGAVGALVGLFAGARASRWLGPLRVSARLVPDATGGTRLDVPPLGHATARTHRGPQVRLLATDVDPDRAAGLLRMSDSADEKAQIRDQLHALLDSVRADARTLGRDLAVRALVGAALGTMGVAAATRRPGVAATGGFAITAALAAVAAATADPDAVRDPQLVGLLAKAPLILGDLQTAPQRIDTYRDQLADLVRTGTGVYRKLGVLPAPPPADAIRLLHVSDIHLSPSAYQLAKALVDEYSVDAVVDTGDLVDWGTPAEQVVATQIAGLGVPYVFVKGNHDSDGIAAAVAAQPNATVLDIGDAPREIAGLRFAGMADPRFTPDKTTGDDRAAHRVSERAVRFAESLRGQQVDIALAHDPAAARPLADIGVPLVLAGHTHRRAARQHGDTVVLVQGTSGGAGLRGVQAERPIPLSLSVLYLDRATKQFWGADEVTLGGIGEVTLSVARRTAAELLAEDGRRA